MALNPYNGLVYSHGAPKLAHTNLLRELSKRPAPLDLDFASWVGGNTFGGLQVEQQQVCVHNYGVSSVFGVQVSYQEGWRLFRTVNRLEPYEHVSNNAQADAESRLSVWMDDSNYAGTFKYMAEAAALGAEHADDDVRAIENSGHLASIYSLVAANNPFLREI
mgnify:CR=1 FL=1